MADTKEYLIAITFAVTYSVPIEADDIEQAERIGTMFDYHEMAGEYGSALINTNIPTVSVLAENAGGLWTPIKATKE